MSNALNQRQLNDSMLIDSAKASRLVATPKSSRILIWLSAAFVLSALVWASVSSLEQVAVGQGRVIPSGNIQTVQNLEGGILKALLVKEGAVVTKGQPILHLDNTRANAEQVQHQQEVSYLMMSNARLAYQIAWLNSTSVLPLSEFKLPDSLDRKSPYIEQLFIREQQGLAANIATLESQLNGFNSKIEQSSQDIVEISRRIPYLKSNYLLGKEELDLNIPLEAQGVISRVEIIKLTRQANTLQQELESNKLLLPKTRLILNETKAKRQSFVTQSISDFKQQMVEQKRSIEQTQQSLISLNDRLARTTIYSPVAGVVKTVHINTQGGVISPGMPLIDIVPNDEKLLIEAHISPRDIGFIRPGQPAIVRFSAYDFAIYGSLQGKLEQISADTIVDEQGNYLYKVKVSTTQTHLGTKESPMPIIPGMMATVDIITGEKTVLDYLLKPIKRAQQHALRER